MSIKIETERLLLRKWQLSDVETLIDLAGQEQIEYWSPDFREYDKHAKGWIEWVLENYEADNPIEKFISWAIVLKKNNQLIGQIAIGDFDELGETELAVAYWMDIKHTNCGYMTEAVKAVAEMVYLRYGYSHIIATIQPANLASNAVIQKAGFKLISTINFLDNGQTEILPFHYYRMDNPHI
jgi:Acetyltransferases, including N-acetylases of ribosomal proteins